MLHVLLDWLIGWCMINLIVFFLLVLFVIIYTIIDKIRTGKDELIFRIKTTKK